MFPSRPRIFDPIVIDKPAREPVTVDEVKLSSRISGNSEDALLDIYIEAARQYLESRTNRSFLQQTLEWPIARFPYFARHIELPRAAPLIEIESATLKDSAGNLTVWDPGEYVDDTDSMPGRIVLAPGASWPTFTPYSVSPIRFRYTAGIPSSIGDECDGAIKYPLLLLIGGMYQNRESEIIPDRAIMDTLSLRYGVEAYIQKLRVIPEDAEL